jgi:diacylglycerol kinase family enzyme
VHGGGGADGGTAAQAASGDNGKVDFFISRAGTDAEIAAVIGRILKDAGYRVNRRPKAACVSIALLSPCYFYNDHCITEPLNTSAATR